MIPIVEWCWIFEPSFVTTFGIVVPPFVSGGHILRLIGNYRFRGSSIEWSWDDSYFVTKAAPSGSVGSILYRDC